MFYSAMKLLSSGHWGAIDILAGACDLATQLQKEELKMPC